MFHFNFKKVNINMLNKNTLTPAEGQILVNEFYNSKLKPGKFCQQKNISYYMLRYWRRKSKEVKTTKSNVAAQTIKSKFLPINLMGSKPNIATIKITVNSKIKVELDESIDLSKFKQILEFCISCG